jgi:hypothetical protein
VAVRAAPAIHIAGNVKPMASLFRVTRVVAVYSQKRPTVKAKVTYYKGKRDLLTLAWCSSLFRVTRGVAVYSEHHARVSRCLLPL